MSLPRGGNWIEQVEFPELNESEAIELAKKFNQQGKDAGYGNTPAWKKFRRGPPPRYHERRSK